MRYSMRAFTVIAATAATGAQLLLSACDGGGSALPKAVAISPDGVRHSAAEYSPDGTRMTWWTPVGDSTRSLQLMVGNADQSAASKLPVTVFFVQTNFWSPDGKMIAAASSEFGVLHTVVVPAAGSGAKRLAQRAGFDVPLGWFPDGDQLMILASTEGGTIRSFVASLKTGVSRPAVLSEKHAYIAFPSPDGSHIAYVVLDGPRTTIWVADSVGGTPRQLTSEGFEGFSAPSVPWSPDGKELVYESRRTGRSDIWVIPIDGGKPRQLTRDVRNDFNPAWSSDGKWIAFLSDRGRQTDIWVVPAAGGAEQRVTDDATEEQPGLSWRPRTHELSYLRNVEKGGIWVLDIANGNERRRTPDSVRAGYFNVAPNGKEVLYVIERGGGIQDLAVVPLAGGGAARTHFRRWNAGFARTRPALVTGFEADRVFVRSRRNE